MSTGLTWFSIVGNDGAASAPYADVLIAFSDYSEAISYGDWWMRTYNQTIGSPAEVKIFIYTTSPNDNGYYYWNSVPVFTVFD